MRKQTIFIGAIFSILLLSTILALSGVFNFSAASTDATINYYSDVCTYVTRTDGSIEDNGCSHNLLTNAGKNAIRDTLGPNAVAAVAFNYIALCNASAGVSAGCNVSNVGDGGLYTEYTTGGLQRTEGTYLALGTGNWSYSKTFTAGADNMVTNKTGIFNVSTGSTPTMLAVNTFTTSTLQTNDQITINWSVWIQ